ncbi:hypothetical protein QAD02_021376 [Eretmocerus hayati]|uniref:Uncharacterized protein n=1 Tax=Eretmocerus hayati TaxID=131215 RepID=A0ACC2PQ35_9HYME|nr:hypothetical protein QAD02_021376 [Eretmocerus hayati]
MQFYNIFLHHCLSIFVKFNLKAQKVDSFIWESRNTVLDMYFDLMLMYTEPERVFGEGVDPISVDPADESCMLDIKEIFFGNHVDEKLSELIEDEAARTSTKLVCRSFLIQACQSIREKFEIEDNMSLFRFIDPQNALSREYHHLFPDLQEVLTEFPRIKSPEVNATLVNEEWMLLLDVCDELPFDIRAKTGDPMGFWTALGYLKNGDIAVFSNVCQIVYAASSITNLNATAERLFSHYNLLHNLLRTPLAVDTIKGSNHAAQHVKFVEGSAKFEPSEEMLYDCNSDMYNFTSSREDVSGGDIVLELERYGIDGDFIAECMSYDKQSRRWRKDRGNANADDSDGDDCLGGLGDPEAGEPEYGE